MKKKVRPVPKFRKEQDERDFWNTHDTTEYFDYSKSKRVENLDYEMFYEDIQAGGTEQHKKDLNAAIRSAFKEMDDNIRTYKSKSLSRFNLSDCPR